jgi:hypothetical protein
LLAQQDRYTLKVPDGLAFSEFRGYDRWEVVAVSETEGSVKAILANPTMIRAYKEGIPDNGKLFPEGSKTVKIEWIKKKNPLSPYFVEVPDTLKSLAFIEKDSKRFPNTHGWVFCLSWKWRKRSSVKITERTYEERTEAFHSRRKSSHPEAASC